MIKYFISILLILFSSPALATVEFSIVTPTGYVAFTVEDHWAVLNMQTNLPITASVFQIPNSGDEGTPDSTNLVLSVYDPKSPNALKALEKIGKPFGTSQPRTEKFENWELFWQEPMQNNTVYSVVDARRNFEQNIVTVRLAWPYLETNPENYNDQMVKTLRYFLKSVKEHNGPWKPKETAVIRRQTQ